MVAIALLLCGALSESFHVKTGLRDMLTRVMRVDIDVVLTTVEGCTKIC